MDGKQKQVDRKQKQTVIRIENKCCLMDSKQKRRIGRKQKQNVRRIVNKCC